MAQLGFRIEEGMAMQGLLMFAAKPEVEKSLETLSGGPGASHLKHLPDGDIITGFSLTGNGGLNGSILRDILSLFTDDFFDRENRGAWIDRQALFGLFDEVWADMRGGRGAIYKNTDITNGLYSALAVIETDDPTKLLEKIQDIALYVNHASDQLTEKKPEVDNEKIAQLIEDLANPDFRTRAEATNRLAMLGDSALPALKKAKESEDLEVRARVTALYQRLERLSKVREDELIKGDLLADIRPKFVFFPEAEKRLDRQVSVAQVTVGIKKETEEALRQILGPEWKNIRLVKLEKQIVLLIGSDLELLDRAIKNLSDDAPGLEDSASVANFKKLIAPVRKAEFHFSTLHYAKRLRPEMAEMKIPERKPGDPSVLTSAALSVHKSAVRADIFFPPSELAVYLKQMGF